jgi:uncharacterized protein YhbP (UPF0306 family)
VTPDEAAANARRIIDSLMYLTLATADPDGRPWASPVWFAAASPTEFLWASDPGSRHSRNLAGRPEVAIVIFDSTAALGAAEAVYVDAVAEQLRGEALERAIAIYSRRSTEAGASAWTLADVASPARLRLYRAAASAMSVLDTGDRRIGVALENLR